MGFPDPALSLPEPEVTVDREGASTIESGLRNPRIFYRIILASTPTLNDFLSSAAKGRAPRTHDPKC